MRMARDAPRSQPPSFVFSIRKSTTHLKASRTSLVSAHAFSYTVSCRSSPLLLAEAMFPEGELRNSQTKSTRQYTYTSLFKF